MSEKQLKMITNEIALTKGSIPDHYRRTFAYIIRDVFQFSNVYPGHSSFLRMCNIPEGHIPHHSTEQ